MKNLAFLFLIILLSQTAFAQNPTPRTPKKLSSTPKNIGNEKEEFEKAVALVGAAERIAALQKFIADFPKSKEKIRALELIVSARAALADEKMRSNEAAGGIELFKLAVREMPKPVSDKLFNEVILQIPNSIFFRGERNAAIEIARLIEEKADGNAKQILALATFYLGTENAAEAKRLAGKAIQLEANLPAAYQTLGIAYRLNFQLEESVNAYAKALELDANSIVSKRSLAEMKRAVGKPVEAIALYREILAKDKTDGAAQTGLILALFDAENKSEGETEMKKSLAENPSNLVLLVGAAYWFAAHNDGAKAIELAEKAIAVESRYTWAHIALARGLLGQKRPLEAEKALLAAQQYGDFPTLDYEIASARLAAGFYREAAESLRKNFAVKDGIITTKLGGRVSKEGKNFIELLAPERRASIFQVGAADNSENADRLKLLLDFSQKLETENDETAIANAADDFVKGDDKMKLHRQLFVANRLLQKRKALPKVLELTKAAIGGVDAALDVPNPSAAVLADELYDSRALAMTRNELVIVPDVSRQTLSNILRGRIEDISGWALFQTDKTAEAVTRLKRAVSVLPEKSSWWRSSMWRLGTALETDGKSKDALDAFIKSYTSGEADAVKYSVVESLYQKVNGNLDGLELKIGAKPASTASKFPVQTEQAVAQTTEKETSVTEPTPETKPSPTVPDTPQPIVETKPTPEVLASQTTTQTVVKTETAPTPENVEKPLSPVEIKTPEIVPDETKTESKSTEPVKNQTSESASKPLFEPIVITVPKVETAKPPTETSKPEIKAEETVQEKTPPVDDIESRPRVFGEKEGGQTQPCKIVASQENISISGGRGSLGVLIGFEGEGDVKEIKATSSSPGDIEITSEPEIGALSGRAFFIVKSISRKTGEFTVTFEAACGKKEISVKVR